MIKREIFFIYIFLLPNILCQINKTLSKIDFIFQRTIYVKKDNKTKVIAITTPNDTEKYDIKLFITENSINKTENYIHEIKEVIYIEK